MNSWKKIASTLLALAMTASLGTTAFAAEETKPGSITIDNASETATYTAYKVFDLTYSENAVAYTMKSDNQFKSLVEGYSQTEGTGENAKELKFTLTATASDPNVYVVEFPVDETTKASKLNGADFAEYMRDAVRAEGATYTGTELKYDAETGTASASNLELGYYFVDSTVGTLCILNNAAPDFTIEEKNETPTIKKESDNKDSKKQIGDTVNFTVTVTAQPGAEAYVVHDVMGAGLTLNHDVAIADLTVGRDYTVNYTPNHVDTQNGNCTFHVEFTQAYLNTITEAKEIIITYSAVINADAVTESIGNKTQLKYGDNEATPWSETDGTPEIPTPKHDVYEFGLVKTTNEDTVLAGAEFKLTRTVDGEEQDVYFIENGNTYTVCASTSTDENKTNVIKAGNVTLKGLGADEYTLTETKAPDGYNKLTGTKTIDLTGKEDNLATVTNNQYVSGGLQVINETGATLPSTGGIGTTIFYVGGGILIAAAGILLVTKKRMSAAA